ncbi:MAG: hypothetical protein ACKODA_11775 [Nevskiaceae bacterium]
MTRILTLAPPLQRGSSATAALGNAQQLIETLQHEIRDSADIVLLPLGCLSGGEGLESRDSANDAIAILRSAAQRLQIILAGADHFGGVTLGFVLAP